MQPGAEQLGDCALLRAYCDGTRWEKQMAPWLCSGSLFPQDCSVGLSGDRAGKSLEEFVRQDSKKSNGSGWVEAKERNLVGFRLDTRKRFLPSLYCVGGETLE